MTHTYTIIVRGINKTPCHAARRKPHRRHTLIISSRKFWIRTQTYTPIYVHIMLRLLFVSRFFTTRKFSTQRVAYMRYSCAIIHTLRLDAYTRHIIIYISVRTCFVVGTQCIYSYTTVQVGWDMSDKRRDVKKKCATPFVVILFLFIIKTTRIGSRCTLVITS